MARGADGSLHVVWYDVPPAGQPILIMYTRRSPAGTWSAPELVNPFGSQSLWPHVAVGSSGTVHVVWAGVVPPYEVGLQDIFHASKPPGGAWSTPTNISNTPSHSAFPDVAVDAAGTAHVVWNDGTLAGLGYASRPAGGSWSTPINPAPGVGQGGTSSITIGVSGTVHIAFRVAEVYVISKAPGASWSAPQNVSAGMGREGDTSIVEGPDGHLHVVWRGYDPTFKFDVYYASRPMGGAWSPAVKLTEFTDSSGYGTVDAASDGSVHVAFSHGDVYYLWRPAGGAWSVPELVAITPASSGTNYDNNIAIVGSDVHFIWGELSAGGYEVLYASRARG
jgi:hypothetical protein